VRKGFVLLIAVLSVVGVSAIPAGAGGETLLMEVNPTTAPPGGTVTVSSIDGCGATSVTVYLDGEVAETIPTNPDELTQWSTEVTIPADAEGTVVITATCDRAAGEAPYNAVTVAIGGEPISTTTTTESTSTTAAPTTTAAAGATASPRFTG
jgi:hypothetical protein